MTAHTLPVIAAILVATGRALAQEAAADALFDSARTAMTKGDFDRACEQFRASDKLDPAPGTELNLADCEEKRGRLASAWELFRTVEEKLSANDERLPVAHERARRLQARVPRLTLTLAPSAPPGSIVRDGSVELGAAAFGLPLPMDPGAHELVVSAPGFAARTFPLTLVEAESRSLLVTPGARTNQPIAAATTPAPNAAHEVPSSASHTRTFGFALGGVGVAGIGVGAIAGVLMLGKKGAVNDGCHPDHSCSSAGLDAAHSARTLEIVSNVGWVVGAAALAAGTYFILTSGPSAKPSTALSWAPNPSGGQLSLSRSW
ncbi:MAG: hypothetical protein ABI488_21550 [Polyangiaceae bacterium]